MSKRIVLISCVSQKVSHPAKVKDLYVSTLFRLNLKYAKSLKPDAIYILSAKHGLLSLEQEIEPYEPGPGRLHDFTIIFRNLHQ